MDTLIAQRSLPVAAPTLHEPGATRPDGDPAQQLLAQHIRFAELAAELDLDDTVAYHFAEPLIREAVDEAYLTAATIAGTAPLAPSHSAPAVVRLRELASAQALLVRALDELRAQPELIPLTSGRARASFVAIAGLRQGLEVLLRDR